MKEMMRLMILSRPARWVITQVFIMTMIFSITSTVLFFDTHHENNIRKDAKLQGYTEETTINALSISNYSIDGVEYYMMNCDTSDTSPVTYLIPKTAPLHDNVQENRDMTIFYKNSASTFIESDGESNPACILDAYAITGDNPVTRIIWYISCGLWSIALVVSIITLTIVELKMQRNNRNKHNEVQSHG